MTSPNSSAARSHSHHPCHRAVTSRRPNRHSLTDEPHIGKMPSRRSLLTDGLDVFHRRTQVCQPVIGVLADEPDAPLQGIGSRTGHSGLDQLKLIPQLQERRDERHVDVAGAPG